jgi:hypothetical protein
MNSFVDGFMTAWLSEPDWLFVITTFSILFLIYWGIKEYIQRSKK